MINERLWIRRIGPTKRSLNCASSRKTGASSRDWERLAGPLLCLCRNRARAQGLQIDLLIILKHPFRAEIPFGYLLAFARTYPPKPSDRLHHQLLVGNDESSSSMHDHFGQGSA